MQLSKNGAFHDFFVKMKKCCFVTFLVAINLVSVKVLNDVIVGRVLRLRRITHWQLCASFESLLSPAGLRHLGKGGLLVASPLEDCLNGLSGSSTRAGTGCCRFTDYRYNGMADGQAMTWHLMTYINSIPVTYANRFLTGGRGAILGWGCFGLEVWGCCLRMSWILYEWIILSGACW